jgi:hypothetical protein
VVKTCRRCGFVGEDNFFIKKENLCKKCRGLQEKQRIENNHIKNKEKLKVCSKCNFVGESDSFVKGRNVCKKCRLLYENKKIEKISLERAGKIETCVKCGITCDYECFVQGRNYCKDCANKLKKELVNKDPNHKEKNKLGMRKWRKNNPERSRQNNINWRKNNIEKTRAACARWRKNNPEKAKEKDRISKLNNPERAKKDRRLYYERNKLTPKYKIRRNMRNAITYMLKSNGGSKNKESSFKNLYYTINDLLINIKNKFESWMNWENQGIYDPQSWIDSDDKTKKWQLDHSIPESWLPYSSMKDHNFKIIWHLFNLRPLSAKQNIKDGNRRNIEECNKLKDLIEKDMKDNYNHINPFYGTYEKEGELYDVIKTNFAEENNNIFNIVIYKKKNSQETLIMKYNEFIEIYKIEQ